MHVHMRRIITATLNGRVDVSNYQSIECLINSLFRLTTKNHQRSPLLSLCGGNPPMTGGFRTLRDSNGENVSIWGRNNDNNNHCYTFPQSGLNNLVISKMGKTLQTFSINFLYIHCTFTFWKGHLKCSNRFNLRLVPVVARRWTYNNQLPKLISFTQFIDACVQYLKLLVTWINFNPSVDK